MRPMRYLEIELISKLNQIFHENNLKMSIETHSMKETKHEKMIRLKNEKCLPGSNYLNKNHSVIGKFNLKESISFSIKQMNTLDKSRRLDTCVGNRNPRNGIKPSTMYYLKSAFENFRPECACRLLISDFEKKTIADLKSEMLSSLIHNQNINADDFLKNILFVVDTVNNIQECNIYSLVSRVGPYKDVSSFYCFFFFNKKRKRITVMDIVVDKES